MMYRLSTHGTFPPRRVAAEWRSGWLVFSFLTAALSLSCAVKASEVMPLGPGSDANQRAALGESFALRIGDFASVDGDAVRVGFIAVAGDSRCPQGEKCFWEGEATVRIWVQPKGKGREEREVYTSGKEGSLAAGSLYRVRLIRLDPRPASGRAIEVSDYLATFQVLAERPAAVI